MNGFERRKEQKKRSIIEASLTLFMKHGIQKVSIAEIAKEANVSQVTIYNYFESKHNLIHEMFIYYIDHKYQEFEQIMSSLVPFPEKIEKIIFSKKEAASQIHEELYQYIMKEYSSNENYVEKLYTEKAIPLFYSLFSEGREQGFIDPNISNEAILFYIQMLKEYIQREEVYQRILP
ncbi:TetR/AcrR family transcriptional regulator [Caldalkalibacillus mannanilyticus]|uniref:TetR/AcrR family transcriptional regulator n=1 Tax=Caldalkalibacillus mannanilyticus TaxID=1418 RepID=UPI000A7BA122